MYIKYFIGIFSSVPIIGFCPSVFAMKFMSSLLGMLVIAISVSRTVR